MAIFSDKENYDEMVRDAMRMATTSIGKPTAEQATMMQSALTAGGKAWGVGDETAAQTQSALEKYKLNAGVLAKQKEPTTPGKSEAPPSMDYTPAYKRLAELEETAKKKTGSSITGRTPLGGL